MRVLLINNGGRPADKLLALWQAHKVTVVEPSGLHSLDDGDGDIIVLAGGYGVSTYDQAYFMTEISLLQTTTRPVIGLAQGFELLCYAYGCQLHEQFELQPGAAKLNPTEDGAKLFQGTDPIAVTTESRWLADDLPKTLSVLARSESGVEAIRHRQKQQYALQLYPEDFKYESDAKMVFGNLLDLASRTIR